MIPFTASQQEYAHVEIDRVAREVVAVRGAEGISRLYRYDVTILATAVEDPTSLLAKEATIALRDAHRHERTIRGIVAEVKTHVEDDGAGSLVVTIRPLAYKLTLGRDSRVFQDATVVDIVKRVLERAEVPARWEVGSAYVPRVYTAQYRESDHAFVSRLCEEEGIYTWFDHEEGKSILVFGDSSASAPDLVGGARVPFVDNSGMVTDVESIEELGPAVRFVPAKYALRSFDHTNPRFKVAHDTADGPFAVYDAPAGGTASADVLAARGKTLNEAAAAARSTVVGVSTSARLSPGRATEIFGHPSARLDKRYVLTEVSVEIVQRRRGSARPAGGARARELAAAFARQSASPVRAMHPTGAGAVRPHGHHAHHVAHDGQDRPFVVRFRAVEQKVPFRAPAVTPIPVRAGLQAGVVVGGEGAEVHPDDSARVRVQLHWDRDGGRDDKAGRWMRVAQRGTAGSMLFPRVGWNVMTMNEEGAPDAPMVMSRVYDAEHPPPYGLPDNMTRMTFKTATTPGGGSFNEIRFEDKSGSEEMFVHASRDMGVLVQNDKSEKIQSNSARDVAVNHSLEVGKSTIESVGKDQIIIIGGSETETVGASREKTVGGSEKSTIGASRNLKSKGAVETSAKGGRSLSVGVAQLDISIGNIKLTTPVNKVLVGGVMVKLTPRKITEEVGKQVSAGTVGGMVGGVAGQAISLINVSAGVGGAIQTIGGAKFEFAGVARTISTKKAYREMVGGMMQLKAGGWFADEAKKESTITVKTSLTAEGENLCITGKKRIEILCGGSTKIFIEDERVSIRSVNVDMSGANIEAKAPKILHNMP